MKSLKRIVGFIALGLTVGLAGFISYVYLINRTIDETLLRNFQVTAEWTEITPNRPLTEYRRVAELAILIPNYKHDTNERLPIGQIRLPDGRIATLEIEAVDENGKTVAFRGGSFTMSTRDLITFITREDLEGRRLSKIRIRSDQPFTCEEIFWRNRNPK